MPEDRLPDFNRYPLLWLATALAAGILAADYIHSNPLIAAAVAVAFAFAAGVMRRKPFAVWLILFAFAAAGLTLKSAEALGISEDRIARLVETGAVVSGSSVEVEGVVRRAPEPNADGDFIELTADGLTQMGAQRGVSGNVRLFVPRTAAPDDDPGSAISDLQYGSRISAVCRIARDDAFLNPGVIPRKQLLDRMGIDATCSVKNRLLIEKLADESVFLPMAWIYSQRARLIDEFRTNLKQPAAGIMIASLLGNKYFLDKDTADLFREGGTFHILVISGLHITFIGGLLLLVIRWFTRNRWVQFAVTMSLMWAYTLAVGADVPVVRAAVMFTIVLFSYAIYRRGSLLNSLGVCALILLVWRPSDVTDASFQLTFVSVAAIVAFAYPLIEKLRAIGSWVPTVNEPFPPNVSSLVLRFCQTIYWNPAAWAIESKQHIWSAKLFKTPYFPRLPFGAARRVIRFLFEGILVSLIVQVWMLPLTVVYFHRVSIASVLLNIWVGFLIAIESFAAVAGVVFGRVSVLLARPFFVFAELVNSLMLSVPQVFTDYGWASFRLPSYSGAGAPVYAIYFVPILILAAVLYYWSPFALRPTLWWTRPGPMYLTAACLLMLGLVIVFHPYSVSRPDGRLRVDFLDVGQGDSALVTFPDGRTLLVDGGGRFRYETGNGIGMDESEPFEPDVRGIGEAVVSEFLWNQGLSRIDYILATHADADHIQGLTDVAKNFKIGKALVARRPMEDPDFAAFDEVLNRRGISEEIVSRGDSLQFGDVTIEVLNPAASDTTGTLENNRSVVLRIVMGSRAFLLTGDIEAPAESSMVTGGGMLAADLVRVPHHGSRTSSTQEFIDATQAKYAVISVGRSSPFGHPHADVLSRWRASGANVMTTGKRGMISVSTDGKDLQVDTFVP